MRSATNASTTANAVLSVEPGTRRTAICDAATEPTAYVDCNWGDEEFTGGCPVATLGLGLFLMQALTDQLEQLAVAVAHYAQFRYLLRIANQLQQQHRPGGIQAI